MFKPRAVSTKRKALSAPCEDTESMAQLSLPSEQIAPSDISREQPSSKKPRSKWGPLVAPAAVVSASVVESVDTTATSSSSAHSLALHDDGMTLRSEPESVFLLKDRVANVGAPRNISISLSSSGISAVTSDAMASKLPTPDTQTYIHSEQGVAVTKTEQATTVATSCEKGYFDGGISHVISDRYRLMACLGKGVFASVFRCLDLTTGLDVALKVLRKGSTAGRSGQLERDTLRRLHTERNHPDAGHGPQFIIALIDDFEYGGHFVIVLERMHTSLRDLLKISSSARKEAAISAPCFLPGGGVDPRVVLSFMRQMLEALRHIHGLAYVHLDIKPDNILVNQDMTHFKICDFGTAKDTSSEISTLDAGVYFAARYYRSPELALAYGTLTTAADIWSLGVTVAEMCGGRVVFKGRNNNELVWNIMNTLGPVPKTMAANCKRSSFFGNSDNEYYNLTVQPASDESALPIIKRMLRPNRGVASEKLLAIITPPGLQATSSSNPSKKDLIKIRDILLNKLLVLDPTQRLSARRVLADEAVAAMDHVVRRHVNPPSHFPL